MHKLVTVCGAYSVAALCPSPPSSLFIIRIIRSVLASRQQLNLYSRLLTDCKLSTGDRVYATVFDSDAAASVGLIAKRIIHSLAADNRRRCKFAPGYIHLFTVLQSDAWRRRIIRSAIDGVNLYINGESVFDQCPWGVKMSHCVIPCRNRQHCSRSCCSCSAATMVSAWISRWSDLWSPVIPRLNLKPFTTHRNVVSAN